jgi:hypothetical protein
MRVTAFMFPLDLAKTVVFDTVFCVTIRDFVPWFYSLTQCLIISSKLSKNPPIFSTDFTESKTKVGILIEGAFSPKSLHKQT